MHPQAPQHLTKGDLGAPPAWPGCPHPGPRAPKRLPPTATWGWPHRAVAEPEGRLEWGRRGVGSVGTGTCGEAQHFCFPWVLVLQIKMLRALTCGRPVCGDEEGAQ